MAVAEMTNLKEQNPWAPEPWQVIHKVVENHDTVTLRMAPSHREKPYQPLAKPGQFNMLYAFGKGEIPISISSIGDSWIEHTIRNVGAVSKALFHVTPGDWVGVRGPFGSSWYLDHCDGYDLVVMAGGVGLAPLKPLIEQILAEKQRFGKVMVFYGARDPHNLLFTQQSEHWFHSMEFLRTVDTIGNTALSPPWLEHIGVVPDLLSHVSISAERVRAFVCGPEIMMRYSITKLIELGVPTNQIYISMERNMKCAIGFCGHCQLGGHFICRDGPVFPYDKIASLLTMKEV